MAGIHVNDPAPRNRALELTGQPSLGSGLGLGAVAEESWIRSPFSPLRTQELMEATAGTEMPETGPVDTGMPLLFQDKPVTPRANMLTPQEANDRFGIPGELSFDQPVRAAQAKLLNRWKRDELKRQNILSRATPGVLPGAARLGVGFLVQAVDPLNVASAFIPVVGEARFAYLTGKLGRTGARLVRGSTEGLVGAAVVEPLVYLQAQSEQADYDAYDSLLNLAFGTALGGGLHAGFGKISDWIRGQPIELRETALRGAVAAVAEDRPVRVAELFGPTRRSLLEGTSLSTPTERFVPPVEQAAEVPAGPRPFVQQAAEVSVPVTNKDGTIRSFETVEQANKAVKNAKRRGENWVVEQQPNGTYRLVQKAAFTIRDEFVDERAALNEVKRIPPKEREGLEVVPRVQPDGSVRFAIVQGLTPGQAASARTNPDVLFPATVRNVEQPPAAPARPAEPYNVMNIMDAQRSTYEPTAAEAAQARNIDTLAEGWDQPITPEQGAEEVADLIEATDEMVAAAKKSGDLTDRDLETIEGDPEIEKATKGRAAGYEAAAACLARVA